jgi:Na+/H+ antiporter NhaD/arsenite permease-like protein
VSVSPTGIVAATWVVFVLVYLGLAVGKLPFLHLDRAGIALVGATAALVLGIITFPKAVESVDFATIALLFGMMVVVAYLRLGGFFRLLATSVLSRARTPLGVLAAVVGLAGLLSAFLVNDVVCLAFGPIVVSLARRIRREPTPYLVALATAANVGSTATITGNPQNMIIGGLSHMPYGTFAARLAPVAALGLALDFAIVALAFRATLARDTGEEGRPSITAADPAGAPDRKLLPKGVAVLVGLVGFFFAGVPVEIAALGAGAVLMLGRQRPERLYAQIDWNLLVMFAGLFVVVASFEQHVVSTWNLAWVTSSGTAPVAPLTAGTAVLSNLVSNVPAVLLLKSIVVPMAPAAREHAWLTLAMASTLSGNLTPVASVANLIVLEGAHRQGIRVSMWDYCRVGVPLTLVTLALGAAWLTFAQ